MNGTILPAISAMLEYVNM